MNEKIFRDATDNDIESSVHNDLLLGVECVTISPGSDVTPRCLDALIELQNLKQLDIFNSNCPFSPSEILSFLRRWEAKWRGSFFKRSFFKCFPSAIFKRSL